jgi:hypothetical protein
MWRPSLLMDQTEMSNLYRGPSIDASYQVSYHYIFILYLLINPVYTIPFKSLNRDKLLNINRIYTVHIYFHLFSISVSCQTADII